MERKDIIMASADRTYEYHAKDGNTRSVWFERLTYQNGTLCLMMNDCDSDESVPITINLGQAYSMNADEDTQFVNVHAYPDIDKWLKSIGAGTTTGFVGDYHGLFLCPLFKFSREFLDACPSGTR